MVMAKTDAYKIINAHYCINRSFQDVDVYDYIYLSPTHMNAFFINSFYLPNLAVFYTFLKVSYHFWIWAPIPNTLINEQVHNMYDNKHTGAQVYQCLSHLNNGTVSLVFLLAVSKPSTGFNFHG